MGQVLEDSNIVGDAMEGRIRKKLEISSSKHVWYIISYCFIF